ncbi:MAG TPA: hypothetical protein VJT75_07380 [Thermoleophilaceae bacterium]|nr:hypothetical protein [Thermoleophilaceae bacterium]
MLGYYALAALVDSSGRVKNAPRLESAVEHLDRELHGRASAALVPLADAVPNDLHEFFAGHVSAGGVHFTLNFDERIEAACQHRGIRARPVALHGRVTRSGDEGVRTRTNLLTGGLTPPHADLVARALVSRAVLVFVGYSGRDYFDVDVFFKELASSGARVEPLRVVWLAHAPGAGAGDAVDWESERVIDGRPILESLARLGATVEYRRADTRHFLRDLARGWGIGLPGATAPPVAASRDWRAEVGRRASAALDDRIVASATLWAYMNLGPPLLRLDRDLEGRTDATARTLAVRTVEARHDGYSRVGRYARAIELARGIGHPGRQATVIGAYERLRGAYVRAWRSHRSAMRYYSLRAGRLSHGELLLRGDAWIEYLFWYYGLRRVPGGVLLRLARAALTGVRAWPRESDPVTLFWRLVRDSDYIQEHPHSIDQLGRLYHELPEFHRGGELPPQVAIRYDRGTGPYVETDSFIGSINRERDALARRIGGWRRRPGERELRSHLDRARAVEDNPGVVKATILLRRAGFRVAFPRDAWRIMEWTRAVRVRYRLAWLRAVTEGAARRVVISLGGPAPRGS